MFEELLDRGRLSFERLHALVLLHEKGSLIRAADGDPGLQSRYSHYLKELSTCFGVELTERAGKNLQLTPNGKKLVELSRQHFEALLQFKNDLSGRTPTFRVGAGDSLLEWLVIPTVASLRRPNGNVLFALNNLGTPEIISRIQDQRLDFGLVANDAVAKGLKTKQICKIRHVIVVPDRVGVRRGMLTLRHALLDSPHAALAGDGSLLRSMEGIARGLGGDFKPELQCESVSQCVAAVRSGQFAAVLPRWSWDHRNATPHSICEDPKLENLDRQLMLVFHPRLLETRGAAAQNVMQSLVTHLKALGTA